jgi:hypothetical protein
VYTLRLICTLIASPIMKIPCPSTLLMLLILLGCVCVDSLQQCRVVGCASNPVHNSWLSTVKRFVAHKNHSRFHSLNTTHAGEDVAAVDAAVPSRLFSRFSALWPRKKRRQLSDLSSVNVDVNDRGSYSQIIDELLALAREYQRLQPVEKHWDCLGQEEDVVVWKLKTPLHPNSSSSNGGGEVDDDNDNDWPCIRSMTTIDLPVDALCDVIMDSSKVMLYNKYSGGRDDVVTVGPQSKIVWSRTNIPFTIKSYDFSTLMHLERNAVDNTVLIVSRGVRCPQVPIHSDYSRSEIIFGLNILTPSKNDNQKTDFETISHVRYAGTHPFIASKSALQGALTYFRSLKAAIKDVHSQK